MDFQKIKTGFFSMEIGLNDDILTYSGGLGILAGDALKSCADLKLPVAGITLLYRQGYFRQRIVDGSQVEEQQAWEHEKHLKRVGNIVKVRIQGQEIAVACWLYEFEHSHKTPILFLDTDLEENPDYFRHVCSRLYQGDRRDRLVQEMILGIGGARMLASLGCSLKKYHMNEGHTALLALELYNTGRSIEEIKSMCVFTTHTPVAAGHDIFDEALVREMASDHIPHGINIFHNSTLNMTHLALQFSGYTNSVARKHQKVSERMFPHHDIESITNGVHTYTWTADCFRELFKKYIPESCKDPFSLRGAINIPEKEIWEAHMASKRLLIEEVAKQGINLNPDRFTIGFARRFAEYKRPDLVFFDTERLKGIAEKHPVQIIFAGKAHPADQGGKNLIRKIIETGRAIGTSSLSFVFLEDYCITTAKLMIAGCDVWLNNPKRPMEASGTSGMKAAINGVPQISTLDGWWLEGHIEGITGWSIGLHPHDPQFDNDFSPEDEARDFYAKLEKEVLPRFYNHRSSWCRMMKSCIAINGSFFHTHRMMQQYVMEAYFR